MSNMKQTVENGIVVFTINIHRWTASRKLKVQHTKANAADLPPADLASLGARKIFDPAALAPFEAIRKETERLCFSEGTNFFGGVAIPKVAAHDFADKLKGLQDRFYEAKATLEQGYDQILTDWRNSHAGWEQTLEGTLEVEEAIRRFSFSFVPVEIVMAEESEESTSATVLEKSIQSSRGAFVGQLYAEIAQMASSYRKDSLLGKEKATARGLTALQSIRKKLSGLAFLDKRIRPLVEMIDKVVAEMPPSGSITGAQLVTLLGVTSILSDMDTMQQYGEQVAAGKDANSLFAVLTQPAPVVVATAQAIAPSVPVAPAVTVAPNAPQASPAVLKVPTIPVQPGQRPAVVVAGWGNIPSRPTALAA